MQKINSERHAKKSTKGGALLGKMQLMGMDKLFHLEGGQDAKHTIISIQKAGLNGQMFHKEVDKATSTQQSQFTGLGVARWAVVPQKDVKHTTAPFSRKTKGKRISGVAIVTPRKLGPRVR